MVKLPKWMIENKIIPVVKIEDAKDAVPLAEAVLAGGLNVIEITFRTAAAADAIKNIKAKFPDMIVGAGTVLTEDNLNQAISARVDFIVAPGFNPKIVKLAQNSEAYKAGKLLMVPGVATPTEVEAAMDMGLSILKFFPAEAAGGIPMLKAFNAVYNVAFIPTGGMCQENAASYLAQPNVAAIGGSWMVKGALIEAGSFEAITRFTKQALELVE